MQKKSPSRDAALNASYEASSQASIGLRVQEGCVNRECGGVIRTVSSIFPSDYRRLQQSQHLNFAYSNIRSMTTISSCTLSHRTTCSVGRLRPSNASPTCTFRGVERLFEPDVGCVRTPKCGCHARFLRPSQNFLSKICSFEIKRN